MKIALMDPYLNKFTDGMVKWWKEQGHEVTVDRYWNPQNAEKADVIWLETMDNNLASATNPGQAILADDANYRPWDLHDFDLSNKKVIVRGIDIECWQGAFAAAHFDVVDDVIFIAPHIRDLVPIEQMQLAKPTLRIHTIPHSVDLDRWTFKERQTGFNIAIVSERWCSKGTDLLLQVILKLKKIDSRYKVTWLGQWGGQGQWEQAYLNDFVEHHNLPIEFINILNDGSTVDEFLEDKNYLLHGSKKEAFSAAMAEAAAKGIKVVAHRFFGADWLWGDSGFLWDTIDEAVEMITDNRYDSQSYRQHLIDKGYTLESMMQAFDKIINNKE